MGARDMPQHHDRLELAAAEPRGPSTSNQGTEQMSSWPIKDAVAVGRP